MIFLEIYVFVTETPMQIYIHHQGHSRSIIIDFKGKLK